MVSSLWSLEFLAKEFELRSRKHNLAHVESDPKLSFSNESTSKLIEVSEKLRNSDSLLLANLSKLSKDILDILWLILLDIDSCDSWSSLWIVVKGVVVSSAHSEELLRRVDVVAEIEVVHLINVSSVHVGLQQSVQNILRS
jgi:hypothetical protein